MEEKKLSTFERYLTIWVLLCIAAGILLGKAAPGIAATLNDFRSIRYPYPSRYVCFS